MEGGIVLADMEDLARMRATYPINPIFSCALTRERFQPKPMGVLKNRS
jgi:hypothetical protein